MEFVARMGRRVTVLSLLLFSFAGWHAHAWAATLTLNWADNSASELGFDVERSTGTSGPFSEIGQTGPGATAYTDSTVSNGTTYCYRVRSFDANNYSPYSNMACATAGVTYGLAVVKMGAGSGTVTSSPSGINCGPSCSGSFAGGSSVTLTATAASGSAFSGWTGGVCSGTGTCTVTLNGATTVTPTFTLVTSGTLSVSPSSVTFTKIIGQPNPPAQSITVTASSGRVWSTNDTLSFLDVAGLPYNGAGGVTGSGTNSFQVVPSSGMSGLGVGTYTGTITVSSSGATSIIIPVTVIVATAATPVGLSVAKTGSGSGTVTSSPAGINCGSTCSGSYASGTTVTLSAAPSSGSTFAGWSGGGCSGTGTCSVSLAGSTSVTASFTAQTTSPSFSVSTTSVTFTKKVGQANPPAQSVTVTASSGQTWSTLDALSFADVVGLPYNGAGGVAGKGTATFQVAPSSGMNGLGVGTYTGIITVYVVGGGPSTTILVKVVVNP